MLSIISFISFFWFIRTVKAVFFWIYLWQLKEYHVGRFLDHFRTYKGKKLIFNALLAAKLVLLGLLLLSNGLLLLVSDILLLLYGAEAFIFIAAFLRGKFKKPVATFKTIFLTIVSFLGVMGYLSLADKHRPSDAWFIFAILLFDIGAPILISLAVLLFQPLFVIGRNGILKKAKSKIAKYPNLIIIGITGSYGKTSTKEFLSTILSKKYQVLKTPAHQNSEIGIATCILKELNEKHQVFIVEMGSYKKGGISLLCDMVKPKIGLVAGVNDQHLALFGSLDNLLSAEGGRELLNHLPADGTLVVNGDNKYCVDLYKKTQIKKKIYTITNDKIDSDIWTEDITLQEDSISFIVKSREKEMVPFTVNVLGKQNVQNLLGASLVARELGMSLEEISLVCKDIVQAQASITLHKNKYGITVIDSSYSSNPNGVIADLDYLNIFSGKKVIIMPCLIELGDRSGEIHRQIGKKIAQVCDTAIITTKDQFDQIKAGAMENGMPSANIMFSENPESIFNTITTLCKSGDAVFLEGRVPEALIRALMQ